MFGFFPEEFMKKQIFFTLSIAVIFLLSLGVSCKESKSESEKKVSLSQTVVEDRLEGLIAGIPGDRKVGEPRTAFAPNEKMSVEGKWRKGAVDEETTFQWISPDGKVAYSKTMNVKSGWTRTHVFYRGSYPLLQGKWKIEVSRPNGTLIGRAAFDVVRMLSEVPIRKQISEFKAQKLSKAEVEHIADAIFKKIERKPVSLNFSETRADGKVDVAFTLFKNGRVAKRSVISRKSLKDSVETLLSLLEKLSVKNDNTIELSFIHNGFQVSTNQLHISSLLRKNYGFSLEKGAEAALLLPTDISRKNFSNALDLLRQLSLDSGGSEQLWQDSEAKIVAFQSQDYAVNISKRSVSPLLHTRTVIEKHQIDSKFLKNVVQESVDWYVKNQKENGLFLYDYEPSTEREPNDNWAIRDLNALYVLSEIYMDDQTQTALGKAIRKSIENYKKYIVTMNDKTFLNWPYHRKVSSIAGTAFFMGALSILNNPQDADLIAKLANTIMSEQVESGRFSTDFIKSDREVDQLYYPGETMLALMKYYEKSKDSAVLKSMKKALPFYIQYFKSNPSAPFVPWQSRAYTLYHQYDKDPRVVDFVFELTDWMLDNHPTVGEKGGLARMGALSGSFASTGVYMEGMVASYNLAKTVGDRKREERYFTALSAAMRYLSGLQFKTEDTYWLKYPEKVVGALATKPSDNSIRLDFTYHAISAIHAFNKSEKLK